MRPLLNEVLDEIAALEQPTRAQIQSLFQPLRQFTQQHFEKLEAVRDSNQNMNSDFAGAVDSQTYFALIEEAQAQALAQLTVEANDITRDLVMAATVGVASVAPQRKRIPKILSRLEQSFNTATRSFDGALTLAATEPEQRYQYVGGIVAESREFCQRMDGRTFTRDEIYDIWTNEDWQGKAPGDPFVVRGGYNCRHQFIPVEGDE
jgi:hypothetical protein